MVAFRVGGVSVALALGVSGVGVRCETLSWAAVMLKPAGSASTGQGAGRRGQGAAVSGRAWLASNPWVTRSVGSMAGKAEMESWKACGAS